MASHRGSLWFVFVRCCGVACCCLLSRMTAAAAGERPARLKYHTKKALHAKCWKYRSAITLFVHLESPCNLWCQTLSFEDDMLPYFACCLALLILSLASTRYRPVTSTPSYSLSRDLRISSFQHNTQNTGSIARETRHKQPRAHHSSPAPTLRWQGT